MRSKIIILTFLILSFLAGCSTNEIHYDDAEEIEIVNIRDENILKVGEDSLELFAFIYPNSAKQEVTWRSSNEDVATISDTGSVIGLRSGAVTIEAFVTYDDTISTSIDFFVYDIAEDDLSIASIISMLDEAIPEIVRKNLNFPVRIEEATLNWQTSDYSIITKNGVVKAAPTNKTINIKVKINLNFSEGEFTKTVIVKAYKLKDISDRKPIFTYLFDSNFIRFKAGDLERIDVINYSFGGIRNHQVSVGGLTKIDTIMALAHGAGVRVVLAIGGWGVDGFSQACRTSETRAIFIASIMETIEKYHFDGIDIDWEYPTTTGGGYIESHPNDRANLTLFLKELRLAMDAVNPDLILSMAVAAGTYAASTYYDISGLANVLDYLHIMSYDMINYTTFKFTHHTNLYPSTNSTFSVSQAVNTYNLNGMPLEKIVIGVAFYAHRFQISADGSGVKTTTVRYKALVEDYLSDSSYAVYTDEVAMANYLYAKDVIIGANTYSIYISYDSPYSIKAKADYVNDTNLGGMMVWEYCQDDDASSLLKAIYENLNK